MSYSDIDLKQDIMDLFERIRQHISHDRLDSSIIDIYVYLVKDYRKAIELEKYFFERIDCTNILMPKYGARIECKGHYIK